MHKFKKIVAAVSALALAATQITVLQFSASADDTKYDLTIDNINKANTKDASLKADLKDKISADDVASNYGVTPEADAEYYEADVKVYDKAIAYLKKANGDELTLSPNYAKINVGITAQGDIANITFKSSNFDILKYADSRLENDVNNSLEKYGVTVSPDDFKILGNVNGEVDLANGTATYSFTYTDSEGTVTASSDFTEHARKILKKVASNVAADLASKGLSAADLAGAENEVAATMKNYDEKINKLNGSNTASGSASDVWTSFANKFGVQKYPTIDSFFYGEKSGKKIDSFINSLASQISEKSKGAATFSVTKDDIVNFAKNDVNTYKSVSADTASKKASASIIFDDSETKSNAKIDYDGTTYEIIKKRAEGSTNGTTADVDVKVLLKKAADVTTTTSDVTTTTTGITTTVSGVTTTTSGVTTTATGVTTTATGVTTTATGVTTTATGATTTATGVTTTATGATTTATGVTTTATDVTTVTSTDNTSDTTTTITSTSVTTGTSVTTTTGSEQPPVSDFYVVGPKDDNRINQGDKIYLLPGKDYKVTGHSSTGTVTYDSSDKSVATIDADGTIHALKEGETTITVSDGTNKITFTVIVGSIVAEAEPSFFYSLETSFTKPESSSNGIKPTIKVKDGFDYDGARAITFSYDGKVVDGPNDVYTAGKNVYQLTINVDGVARGTATAYIGVRGDTDLDGKVESKDATANLVWYANYINHTPNNVVSNYVTFPARDELNVTKDSNVNKLAAFLGDANLSDIKSDIKHIDSKDATGILRYYGEYIDKHSYGDWAFWATLFQ